MATAIAQGKSTGTLLAVDFKPKPKFALKIVNNSLLEMLGSFHQISLPQQKILTALFSDEQWNWEELFISSLFDIAKGSKLRLCTKVSALILHAARGRELIWGRTAPVNGRFIKAKVDKALPAAGKSKKSTKAKGSKSSSSSKKGEDESAGNLGGKTVLPPVPEASVTESTWKSILVVADEAADVSSVVPSILGIPSSIPTGAELTSASEKALGKRSASIGPLPVSLHQITPQSASTPTPTNPSSPDLEYTGTITPQTKLLQTVQSFNDSLQEKVDDYISDHFPILFDYPEPLDEVRCLLHLVFLKTSRWYEIRELVLVDTWTDLGSEESEVYTNFGIRNLWIAIQSLDRYIVLFCRHNEVPLSPSAMELLTPQAAHEEIEGPSVAQPSAADQALADSFLHDTPMEPISLSAPTVSIQIPAAAEALPRSTPTSDAVEQMVEETIQEI